MPNYNLLITGDFTVWPALVAGFAGSVRSCKKPIMGSSRIIARVMVSRVDLKSCYEINAVNNRPPLEGPQRHYLDK